MSKMSAEGRVDGVPGTVDAQENVECTEAAKEVCIPNYPHKYRCSLNRNLHCCLNVWLATIIFFLLYGMFRMLTIRFCHSHYFD
jgi:hypothetical protein